MAPYFIRNSGIQAKYYYFEKVFFCIANIYMNLSLLRKRVSPWKVKDLSFFFGKNGDFSVIIVKPLFARNRNHVPELKLEQNISLTQVDLILAALAITAAALNMLLRNPFELVTSDAKSYLRAKYKSRIAIRANVIYTWHILFFLWVLIYVPHQISPAKF